MKILVFAHRLEVGGTQVNAIELAAALRDFHGHEVVLFATPGPMAAYAVQKGLRHIPAPDARLHPSPSRMRALRAVVNQERPDVIHVWDWWQCLEAYYAVHLPMRIPLVVTDMMMQLTRVLPRDLPTTFGTPALVDHARSAGRKRAELLLPPVDTRANAPGVLSPITIRRQFNVGDDEILVVTVSRLADYMKSESLVRSLSVMEQLGRDLPIRFLVVGDGSVRERLTAQANAVNASLGRQVVVFAGAMADPRAAYAAADIVVGMGGSALRGMSFAKPVVVVGERGFSEIMSPARAEQFLYEGLYGLGDGSASNAAFAQQIRQLAETPQLRDELGDFSRRFIVQHFSLETVSARLSAICHSAQMTPPRLTPSLVDAFRTALVYLRERRYTNPSRELVAVESNK